MVAEVKEWLAQFDWLLWGVVIAVAVVGWVIVRRRGGGKTQPAAAAAKPAEPKPSPATPREPDAIYQKNRVVARVIGAQVDETAQQIRFEELYSSDDLLVPDECEYQKYRLMIRTIEFATKVEKGALHKGRVLRGLTADILGYVEQ